MPTRLDYLPTPLAKFEQSRVWAVSLLRRLADDLEHAERPRAFDALLHLAGPLQTLDRASRLALLPRRPPAA